MAHIKLNLRKPAPPNFEHEPAFVIHFDLISMNVKELESETLLAIYRVAQCNNNCSGVVARYLDCINELKRRDLSTRYFEQRYKATCECEV